MRASLFTSLPLCIEGEEFRNSIEETLEEVKIDFSSNEKQKLAEIILSVQGLEIGQERDDYSVRVQLKDDSLYAYAPRRFVQTERLEIRKITDNLLQRGIIKPSVSPYCARVVPVRKRNGALRLCVDLRPLNSRVAKQKYPFPLIENCLERLGNKSVFTLLDLKDSFHQIRVHADCTKYFSFATPDGQFEYTCLPFGYCEAPAEFQKRLVQILSPLVREDRVVVYMDDVLIPSESVDENLKTLKDVLIILKKYKFELNYKKCKFLRMEIEFLGYAITTDGVTLCARHTDAIRNFKQPEKVHEVQRFLGLAGYFRKFIEKYSIKAKPLFKLLRKEAKFKFDNECCQSFETLKKELTLPPVLRLYDRLAETELHTDACSLGLGAILIQKQNSGPWSPVAYFGQTTNNAEKNYHGYELEMLAMVRAVERFHIYLYGLKFTVVTDCHALV